jgi:predicted XRE-type DNA-binding protein
MKRTTKVKSVRVNRGSGNVFADLNMPNADELLAKAKLVVVLAASIEAENLTQVAIAKRLGLTQPKVSLLLQGHTEGFTLDKIMYLLRRMKKNVDITISKASPKAKTGRVTVSASMPMHASPVKR